MLDLDTIRAEFAAHLAANAGQRWRLDASVAHVCEIAYRAGLADAERASADAADRRRAVAMQMDSRKMRANQGAKGVIPAPSDATAQTDDKR